MVFNFMQAVKRGLRLRQEMKVQFTGNRSKCGMKLKYMYSGKFSFHSLIFGASERKQQDNQNKMVTDVVRMYINVNIK